ncbi:MAG: ATP-binding protein, partial [Candidatus Peribacteria bacterium]|nr:ATP-binding protein [Candidatus Peribacteria bacterium]
MFNNFDFLKSKIRELHIPLPNFKYFHKPSSEEEVFENFIGREEISERLEEWLTKGNSGAYLITGYRGMGKSSFVGNVLNKITRKTVSKWWVRLFTIFCSLFITSFVLLFFILSNNDFSFTSIFDVWFILILLLGGISILGIISIHAINKTKKYRYKFKRYLKNIDKIDYAKHKTWFEKVYGIKNTKENKHNLVIKLNLGHETLKEKDILSLIAKRIYDTYKGYLSDFYTNWFKIIFKTLILFFGATLIVWFLGKISITSFLPLPIPFDIEDVEEIKGLHIKSSDIYQICYKFVKKFVKSEPSTWFFTPLLIVKIILVFVFYFLLRRLWNFVVSQIPFLYKHSTAVVLGQLKFLIDRIEAAVTEDSGPNSGYMHSTSLFSFNFSRRKHKIYPNASTREIEDELIQIFQKIEIASSFPFPGSPKFIIVFDELDKIDPVYNHIVKVEQDVPEFKASTAFQGGSAIRDRKQNVLKLLGNMKLFMSQTKAKFVFISGRELYDAFLADLADREFAASSIFNGVIYVDSFLESSKKQKNIITKTEEYICGYLIPRSWYRKYAIDQYKKETGQSTPHLKLENITYRYPNLRMYKTFLIKILINDFIINEIKTNNTGVDLEEEVLNLKFESYKQFLNVETNNGQIKYKQLFEKNLLDIEQTFLYIDKVIVFLNQFSIYLTHICNGSPKKITIYFEQYIKSFIPEHPKNPFSKSKDKDIKKSKYCLS